MNVFLLKLTSDEEVHKLISHLNSGNALGPITITHKDIVNILSSPLRFIINKLSEQDIFPESLKTPQVTPGHKEKTFSLLVTTALHLYCQFQ